jgi:hypothetical protein
MTEQEYKRLHLPSPGALPGIPGIHSGTIVIHHKDGMQRVLTAWQWQKEIEAKEKSQKDDTIQISGTDQHGNAVEETVVIDDAVRATMEFIMQAKGE